MHVRRTANDDHESQIHDIMSVSEKNKLCLFDERRITLTATAPRDKASRSSLAGGVHELFLFFAPCGKTLDFLNVPFQFQQFSNRTLEKGILRHGRRYMPVASVINHPNRNI